MKIPLVNLSRQYKTIEKETNKIVQETFSRGDFILGKNVKKFEQAFASYLGVKYCIGVASGTDALLLSLRALGIGPGDEVITTTFTFIGTVLPITYLGAKPVLCDIDPTTYQIDPRGIEKVITKKTKAIIPVHLYGYPAPILEILNIAKRNKLYVVEDCAQAHGSAVNGRRCGSFGDLAAFSFYPSKSLGAPGDGGAIVTNNKKLTDNLRALRNVGQFEKYKHDILGYNSRLDSLHAGILSMKLKRLEEWNSRRQNLARLYDKFLSNLPVVLPPKPSNGFLPNYFVYLIRSKNRDNLLEFLKKSGVDCAIYYPIPLHLQKSLKYLGYTRGEFKVAEKTAQEVLSIPMYPELKKEEVGYIVSKIRQFFKK